MSKSLWSAAAILLEEGDTALYAVVVEADNEHEATGKAHLAFSYLHPRAWIKLQVVPFKDEYIIVDPKDVLIKEN